MSEAGAGVDPVGAGLVFHDGGVFGEGVFRGLQPSPVGGEGDEVVFGEVDEPDPAGGIFEAGDAGVLHCLYGSVIDQRGRVVGAGDPDAGGAVDAEAGGDGGV